MVAADPCVIYIKLPLPLSGRIYALVCIFYIVFIQLKPLAGPGWLVHNDVADIVLGYPEFAPAGMVCSQTFIYAKFNTDVECRNFISYLKCKFFRALVFAAKITQDALASVYRFVPIQDFTKPWTDSELYAKYDLSDDEIAFIESMIKPME